MDGLLWVLDQLGRTLQQANADLEALRAENAALEAVIEQLTVMKDEAIPVG